MHIHSLQHVPFEGLGSIEAWVQRNTHTLTSTRTYLGEAFPAADGFDLLIVMGGPMSVHDEKQHPWLLAEKRCIEQAIERGRKVLGICLGAQLIASVLGASVYANKEKGNRLVLGGNDWCGSGKCNFPCFPTFRRSLPLAWRHLRSAAGSDPHGAQPGLRTPGLCRGRSHRRAAISSGNNPGKRPATHCQLCRGNHPRSLHSGRADIGGKHAEIRRNQAGDARFAGCAGIAPGWRCRRGGPSCSSICRGA